MFLIYLFVFNWNLFIKHKKEYVVKNNFSKYFSSPSWKWQGTCILWFLSSCMCANLSLSCHNISRASRAYVIHCHRDSKNNVTTVECETVNLKYMAGKFIRYHGFCHITIQIENRGWGSLYIIITTLCT